MASSSFAVASGVPPLAHCAMSPAPTKVSGGSSGRPASGLNGVPPFKGVLAAVTVDSALGDVSGELPPHERHSVPTAAMLHLTIRITGCPSDWVQHVNR